MSWANNSNFPTPYDTIQTTSKMPVAECALCGEGIADGESYYELIEGDYCESCIESFKRIRVYE